MIKLDISTIYFAFIKKLNIEFGGLVKFIFLSKNKIIFIFNNQDSNCKDEYIIQDIFNSIIVWKNGIHCYCCDTKFDTKEKCFDKAYRLWIYILPARYIK